MKRIQSILRGVLGVAILGATVAKGQAPVPTYPAVPTYATAVLNIDPTTGEVVKPALRFDIHFQGGPVESFVQEVSKASGKPVNVIVPPPLSDAEIPPLQLKQVSAPELFEALTQASRRRVSQSVASTDGRPVWKEAVFTSGFRTADRLPSHDSIWYFFRDDAPGDPSAAGPGAEPVRAQVRVLNMTPFLKGRTIDDITTAIRTACDMVEGVAQPKLTFHKETNLLITRGVPEQLELIDRILQELGAAPAPDRAGNSYPLSQELMKRYGLLPAPQSPATESAPK